MTVIVKKFFDPSCWYSEMIGESFICYVLPGSPFLFVNETMFLFPQDVEQAPEGAVLNFSLFNNKAAA